MHHEVDSELYLIRFKPVSNSELPFTEHGKSWLVKTAEEAITLAIDLAYSSGVFLDWEYYFGIDTTIVYGTPVNNRNFGLFIIEPAPKLIEE